MRFAELVAATGFSFLDGASQPEEMVAQAKALGLPALGIADRNTVAGVVRAHVAAKQEKLRFLAGSRLCFADAPDIVCYPEDRAAWGRLCRLLSLGKSRTKKGECDLHLSDLRADATGQVLIVIPPAMPDSDFDQTILDLVRTLPGQIHLAATRRFVPDDADHLARLAALARHTGAPLIATTDALYHVPGRRVLQDVLRCAKLGCRIDQAGLRLEPNGERHLKPAAEMVRLFRDHPEAVSAPENVLRRVRFSLDDLAYEYPDEPVPPGTTPDAHLAALTWEGATARYPKGVPEAVRAIIARELALIAKLDYAPYFLTVNDIVRFARSHGILCQGRGSAANSAVCYALGVTAVDPAEINLLFERFVSAERQEPPDIDVDFEHERREEVIQYLYDRYGRDRAALAATVIHYRPKSAIREVAKALGLAEDAASALAAQSWNAGEDLWPDDRIREAGLDPSAPVVRRTVELARDLIGLPRHLSQHVGGFVLSRTRLDETVPIGPAAMACRSFIEWDKDDIDALGLMKVDVLALGMLTAIRKCFAMLGIADLANIPREDPAVYDMLCRGDSLGVFQVESRAQMNMLPRLKPQEFYDLVIEVAIVRPGPIQGDMVHPYLRRRNKEEAPDMPSPELHAVLGKTLGVPLFQEQAMRIAIEAAGFSPEEANSLRRAMATFRNPGTIHRFFEKMVEGMISRGYERDFAERCFRQIEGFGTYGFPESHAASFAHLVYVSSWLKCFHPAEFAAALLNSQPMGFYAPAQIVRDAREHDVSVLPVDAMESEWNCTAGQGMLRLGFRMVDGFREDWAGQIVAARRVGRADPLFLRRAGLPRAALDKLAEADGFAGRGLGRREALWQISLLDAAPEPALLAGARRDVSAVTLPKASEGEKVVADYRITGLSLRAHPMALLRHRRRLAEALTCDAATAARDGARVKLAGLVTVRQRPGSARGTMFITIEDETGIANLVIWPSLVEPFRREIIGARLLGVVGQVQKSPEGVTHVVAERLVDLTDLVASLDAPAAPDDELPRTHRHARPPRHPRSERVIPKSRDFH